MENVENIAPGEDVRSKKKRKVRKVRRKKVKKPGEDGETGAEDRDSEALREFQQGARSGKRKYRGRGGYRCQHIPEDYFWCSFRY